MVILQSVYVLADISRGNRQNSVFPSLNILRWDFPGSPVAKTPCSQCRVGGGGLGSIPGQGNRSHVPH